MNIPENEYNRSGNNFDRKDTNLIKALLNANLVEKKKNNSGMTECQEIWNCFKA